MPRPNVAAAHHGCDSVSARRIWSRLMVVITRTPAPMETARVSTVRTPNRVTRSGSMSASGTCSRSASRTSAIRPRRARNSSRVARGMTMVCSSGPIVASSSPLSTRPAEATALAGPTRSASSASIWAMSTRLASSDEATSPLSQPVSSTPRRAGMPSTSTASAVSARCARPAWCARRSWLQTTSSAASSISPVVGVVRADLTQRHRARDVLEDQQHRVVGLCHGQQAWRAHARRGSGVAEQRHPLGDLPQRHDGAPVDAAEAQRAPPAQQDADHLTIAVQREHVAAGAVVVDHRVDPLVGVAGDRHAGRVPRQGGVARGVVGGHRVHPDQGGRVEAGTADAVHQDPTVGPLGLHAGRVAHAGADQSSEQRGGQRAGQGQQAGDQRHPEAQPDRVPRPRHASAAGCVGPPP